VHVPYKGSGASVQDLISGQIPVVVSTLSAALPYYRQGRVRTLAVMKGQRSTGAPDIPTTEEAGVPGVIAYTYNILVPPAGTPRDVVSYLSGTMNTVMADHTLVDALVTLGVDPVTDSNPEKAAAMIQTELAKWAPLIKSLGLRQ